MNWHLDKVIRSPDFWISSEPRIWYPRTMENFWPGSWITFWWLEWRRLKNWRQILRRLHLDRKLLRFKEILCVFVHWFCAQKYQKTSSNSSSHLWKLFSKDATTLVFFPHLIKVLFDNFFVLTFPFKRWKSPQETSKKNQVCAPLIIFASGLFQEEEENLGTAKKFIILFPWHAQNMSQCLAVIAWFSSRRGYFHTHKGPIIPLMLY